MFSGKAPRPVARFLPTDFSKTAKTGIFTNFVKEVYTVKPLSTVLGFQECAPPHYLHLVVDPVFSPILRESDAAQRLGPDGEEMVTELRRGFGDEVGKHGYSVVPASHPELAAQGRFTLVKVSGDPVYDLLYDPTMPGNSRWADQSAEREAQFELLRQVADILEPYYGFIIDNNDIEFLDSGDLTKFPPLEPWTYFWYLMVYGKKLQHGWGSSHLLKTPAERVIESKAGLIWLQPFDYVFYKRGTDHPDVPESVAAEARLERFNTLLNYLSLKHPVPMTAM